MAPSPITEDYYMVLEIEQTATPEMIVKSYKRLALKLHPDRNTKYDATEAFQLLGRAYETLRDEGKRRVYDLVYPSIKRSTQSKPTPRPPPTPSPQSNSSSEAAQIVALEKLKQERGAQWRIKKNVFDSSIFEKQRVIRRLEQEIKNLKSIAAAEAVVEAQKNSWGTWLLSPLYKKVEDSEEEKERKNRKRQERRVEKDMKERRMSSERAELTKVESLLRKAKEEVDTADLGDDYKIRVIQDRIRTRETQERQKKERIEREQRLAKLRQEQQEQRERQAREQAKLLERQRAEARAAEQKRHEANIRAQQKIFDDEIKRSQEQHTYSNIHESRARQAYSSTCNHDGWWPKMQGRTACPRCSDVWTYMLQCPGCQIKACPKCQAALRPTRPHNAARTSRHNAPRARSPSPSYDYYDDY